MMIRGDPSRMGGAKLLEEEEVLLPQLLLYWRNESGSSPRTTVHPRKGEHFWSRDAAFQLLQLQRNWWSM